MDYYYFLRQVYELKKDLWQCYASNITRMFSKNYAFWQYYGSNCGRLMIQITIAPGLILLMSFSVHSPSVLCIA